MLQFIRTKYLQSFEAKTIPSLDGIRAISCLFVIIGHFSYLYADWFLGTFGNTLGSTLVFTFGNQYTGVTFFFVLSGFLITNILIEEIKVKSTINYKHFFLKRVFRIFPAYYFYFGLILAWMIYTQLVKFSGQDLFAAVTYSYNYYSDQNPWQMAHFWSLAVEEQFYLIWPLIFLLTYKKFDVKFPLLIILISPLVRLFCPRYALKNVNNDSHPL